MPDNVFQSKLGPDIEAFIAQKRAAGYPYVSASRILKQLDVMIAQDFPEYNVLSKEICNAWIEKQSKLHQNTLMRKVTPVRQLAKYLIGSGIPAYIIPSGIPAKQIRYDAHIFTEAEVRAFFTSIDSCKKSPFSQTRCYVIPVIFRLLFCCGLRSSEARLLRVDDVNLTSGKIMIRKSKGWEARIIYVSNDMLDLLQRYNQIIDTIIPDREPFFPNHKGGYYDHGILDVWFHEFWDHLPEAAITKGNKPRVHDARHFFCCYRLNKWVKDNRDINGLLPYLSEYVGHSHYEDTDYYLTLAEPFYPEFESRMHGINVSILPEVTYEEK